LVFTILVGLASLWSLPGTMTPLMIVDQPDLAADPESEAPFLTQIFADRVKTGRRGYPENSNGPQTLTDKALAIRVSFEAEGKGLYLAYSRNSWQGERAVG
jgi:hypothetical protein